MSNPRGCVDETELDALVAKTLPGDDTSAIAEHAESCATCRSRIDEATSKATPTVTDNGAPLSPVPAESLEKSAVALVDATNATAKAAEHDGAAEKVAPRAHAPSEGAARLPLIVGIALLAVIAAGGLAANPTPPETTPLAATPKPPEAGLVIHSRAAVNDGSTRERVHTAFEKVAAPAGAEAATMALLRAAADELDADAQEAQAIPGALGRRECLALLDEDVIHLLDELPKLHDRSAAEGAVLAARDLEHPSVCRGAGPDPAEAGRDRVEARSTTQLRMRLPTSLSPVTPGRFDSATKRGLFAFVVVQGALARDPNAFPEDADLRPLDDMLDSMMKRADDPKAPPSDDTAGTIANKGLALALDAGKPNRAADTARALSFAEILSMDSLRARVSIFASAAAPEAERGRILDELAPLVKRVDDATTTTAHAIARVRNGATKGARAAKEAASECAAAPVTRRARCVAVLEAIGNVDLDRDPRDVTVEVATCNSVYGEGHPHTAFAKVHEAEWQLAHGNTDAAIAGAKDARASLETSLEHDANVELAERRAFVPGGPPVEMPRLGPWATSKPIGDEAYAKYVHLARAYAVIVTAGPEADARAAAKAGRALRGRDDVDAVILPVELASAARFSDPTRGYDMLRAATALGHPVFGARALARAGASETNPEKAVAANASALALLDFLPPSERAMMRFTAAKRAKDREVARALLEKAVAEASAKDKPAIEAYRDSLR